MRRILRKIKFNIYKVYVLFVSKIFTINSSKSVALVSCNKWKNKVLEDIRLKYYLSKIKIKTDIISYEDKLNYNYDAVIIRSIWGFNIDKFNNWLDDVDKKGIKIFNNIKLIKKNYSKKEQFNTLDKYNIKHITTYYVDKNLEHNIEELLKKYDSIVIKPHISESGNNTYVLPYNADIKNSISKVDFINKNVNTDLYLVQPFYKSVNNGEISVIVIDKRISHAVVRYPGVFGNFKETIEFKIDDELENIVNKIINIKEFDEELYLRIDFIKEKDEYLVLEIELIDPMLFLNVKSNKKEIKKIYNTFCSAIKKRL